MTTPPIDIPNSVWKNKTFSFLVRTRQELWGKNNEDIMAWLFLEGFSNRFINEQLLGWNRYAKIRPAAAWALPQGEECHIDSHGKFTLPPGIVIPYLVEKEIVKLLIYDYQSDKPNRLYTLPGSSQRAMILGATSDHVAVVFEAMHALLVLQELGETVTVIHPDTRGFSPDPITCEHISHATNFYIFSQEPFSQRDKAILAPWSSVTGQWKWITYTKPEQIIEKYRTA
jgi:hypothetical protein